MAKRDPIWAWGAVILALGAIAGIAGVAYHQHTELGRLLAGLTALVAAWSSGVSWTRYRLRR